MSWPRIVLLGDSITQYSFQELGWGSYIQNLLQRKCDVYNRGYSGYNTKMILSKLKLILNDHLMKNIVAITLFLGANDAALPEIRPGQHVSLKDYENNLQELIDKVSSYGVQPDKIIVITPPPVCEEALLQDIISKGEGEVCTRTNNNAKRYAQTCIQVAKKNKCRSIDLWTCMTTQQNINYSDFLSDGLHLSEKGNQFLAELLQPHIEELTNDLSVNLPLWREFKYDDEE